MSIIISRDLATGAYWCMANQITPCNCHVVGLCLHLTNISAVNMKSDSNNTTSFVDARAWLKSVTTCGHLCNIKQSHNIRLPLHQINLVT